VDVIAKSRAQTKPYRALCRMVVVVTLCGASLAGCMGGLDLFENNTVDTVRTSSVPKDAERLTDEITVRNTVSSADLAHTGGSAIPWANTASGSAGVISSIAENRDDAGRPCRDFVTTRHSYQGIANYTGRTCRNNSGEWLLLDFDLQG
jgi:hypothetical protein